MARIRVTPNVEHQPQTVWHCAEGRDLPGTVWFRLRETQDGGWVCNEVLIEADDAALTTTTLRNIPLTRIVEQLMTMPLSEDDRGGPLDPITGVREWYDGNLFAMPDAAVRPFYLRTPGRKPKKAPPRPRRGGAGPTPEELDRFAAAYRWALVHERRRPVAAAADRMSIAPATAHRWLKLLATRGDR